MNFRNISWAALILGVILATGCGTKGDTKDGSADGGAEAGAGAGAETTGAAGAGAWDASALEDPNSPLFSKVIYFDYDVAELRSEFIDMLKAHAEYLSRNPDAKVVIEGHCDERGSREYNIALGERRANAVMRFFEAEGVRSTQIETVSYGEERPEDYGHSEAAWAMNRRAVLVYCNNE